MADQVLLFDPNAKSRRNRAFGVPHARITVSPMASTSAGAKPRRITAPTPAPMARRGRTCSPSSCSCVDARSPTH
eukprot:1870664-Amphidinium_carterae.1